MYEEKQTFDVLKGTIPDFSTKDITLAFTIDGQTQTNTKFPNKGDGYIVEEVSCEEGVKATWNSSTWSLENIENNESAKKVKCTVAFKTTGDLNGAEPVLGEGMIPVVIKDNGKVYKTSEDSEDWYDYGAKQWANAVILTDEAQNKEYEDGIIPENDIESYFVWIPKFSYQLFDMGKYAEITKVNSKNNMAINIRIGVTNTSDSVEGECTTPMNKKETQGLSGESGKCEVKDYMTHPAFLAFDTTGLWVGKFESGYKNAQSASNALVNSAEVSKLVVKPNQFSWRNINVGNAFNVSKNYKTNLQSHMMKNTEWGAVAYLTQSIYGRCANVDGESMCEEVTINNNSNYITGYAGGSISATAQSVSPEQNGTNTFNYNDSASQVASTTGNYSGIYDMSGGTREYVASCMLNSATGKPYRSDGLQDSDFENLRYFDFYNYESNTQTNYNKRILGDATGEVGPFQNVSSRNIGSWYGDEAWLPNSADSWFGRGGYHAVGAGSGVFEFCRFTSAQDNTYTFRIVLAPANQ